MIQAEDDIRDYCLSRGLGDVYKRQLFPLIARLVAEGREGDAVQAFRRAAGLLAFVAVPITVLMAVYAQEVAQMAFGRGACDCLFDNSDAFDDPLCVSSCGSRNAY